MSMDAAGIRASEDQRQALGRRVGDTQRAACAEALAEAFVAGELSQTEFDARTELCLASVTDIDLAQLTSDLAIRTAEPSAEAAPPNAGGPITSAWLCRFVAYQLVLLVIAGVLGVDLESEVRSSFVIAFEIWVVGTLAGIAGALVLGPGVRRAR